MMAAVTIAGQVAAMADAPAGQAPGEAMVFAREQAELAAGGIRTGHRVGCFASGRGPVRPPRRPGHVAGCDQGSAHGSGVVPESVVPLLHHHGEDLPVRAPARAHPPRSGLGGDQLPEAGRLADHAAKARTDLHRPVRPGQPGGTRGRRPVRPLRPGARRSATARPGPHDGQRRRRGRGPDAGEDHYRRGPRCGMGVSTRITQRVPSPGRSLPHSAEPASEAAF